ncbi:MAG: hypothetical protein O3A87_01705 [Verrucomicrobia bacterium]|nr:hypothetical protein [Verrucomicrobiota bacterium]MDA1005186.1 hypothetical protein [Verrucomicrobiota bacterium]
MRTLAGQALCLCLALGSGGSPAEEPAPAEATVPAWKSDLPPLPELTPPSAEVLEKSIRAGVDFLVSRQNANGSWGGPTETKGLNIYAPIPGAHHAFRSGASGLALYGILASRDQRASTKAAIDKAEVWFLAELPRLRRAEQTTTYNVWGHAYGLRALCALYEYRAGDEPKRSALKALGAQQVELLQRYEDINGGWGYLDLDATITRKPSGIPTSFTTASAMIALHEAREVMGLALPEREVDRGLRFLQRQQTPDFAYLYSDNHRYRPRYPINRPAGSLCRSQACSAARRYFGDEAVTDEILKEWLKRLILRNGWVDIARKRPVPHETHFQNSGYFYYYGHFYATDCIALLPEADQLVYYQNLATILLPKQEKDGSWWDYPLYSYHKPYGTGYVLATLSRCRDGGMGKRPDAK